jgi:hypothetical protein
MTNYRRNFIPGASYFFTVNLFNRRSSLLLRDATDFSRHTDYIHFISDQAWLRERGVAVAVLVIPSNGAASRVPKELGCRRAS